MRKRGRQLLFISLLFTIILLTNINANAQFLTGPINNPANGHIYYLTDQSTWTMAESQAINIGGHLVTINDAVENQWIFDTFSTYGGVNRLIWIGLNDLGDPGNFQWVSGEPVTYLNWAPGEPNFIGEERYAFIYGPGLPRPASFWNNGYDFSDFVRWGDNGHIFGVVEIVPEPISSILFVTGGTLLAGRSYIKRKKKA